MLDRTGICEMRMEDSHERFFSKMISLCLITEKQTHPWIKCDIQG